eukprot:CAMPEP_0184482974 /NCGR_PEP_ID=MMETSP0113_2-20130426/4570_1 /TAXON_ID=91329 /ORGANISM="Norrisiella sphaerica, Strain BC52" /LENGTH=1072 /DNA_ID=CAMNT_0026863049 /DNA_START=84 /DNA_END=3302 /DNA_ORIENTATION=+
MGDEKGSLAMRTVEDYPIDVHLSEDADLKQYSEHLKHLKQNVRMMARRFKSYACSVVAMCNAAERVSQPLLQFYQGKGKSIQGLMHMQKSNSVISHEAVSLFGTHSRFEAEIMENFDRWMTEINAMSESIRVTQDLRKALVKQISRRESLEARKKRKESWGVMESPQERLEREKAFYELKKLSSRFRVRKQDVKSSIPHLMHSRYNRMDSCSLRLMEFQFLFASSAYGSMEPLRPHISMFLRRIKKNMQKKHNRNARIDRRAGTEESGSSVVEDKGRQHQKRCTIETIQEEHHGIEQHLDIPGVLDEDSEPERGSGGILSGIFSHSLRNSPNNDMTAGAAGPEIKGDLKAQTLAARPNHVISWIQKAADAFKGGLGKNYTEDQLQHLQVTAKVLSDKNKLLEAQQQEYTKIISQAAKKLKDIRSKNRSLGTLNKQLRKQNRQLAAQMSSVLAQAPSIEVSPASQFKSSGHSPALLAARDDGAVIVPKSQQSSRYPRQSFGGTKSGLLEKSPMNTNAISERKDVKDQSLFPGHASTQKAPIPPAGPNPPADPNPNPPAAQVAVPSSTESCNTNESASSGVLAHIPAPPPLLVPPMLGMKETNQNTEKKEREEQHALKRLGLRKWSEITPKIKTKRWHWETIPLEDIQNTAFHLALRSECASSGCSSTSSSSSSSSSSSNISSSEWNAIQLFHAKEAEQIQEEFRSGSVRGRRGKKSRKNEQDAKAKENLERSLSMLRKPALVRLLDKKRTRNVLIALAGLKTTTKQLVAHLSSMNVSALKEEVVGRIFAIFPSQEEVKLIQSYGGNVESLAKAERFLFQVSARPMLKTKIKWVLFMFDFTANMEMLWTGFLRLRRALDAIVTSSCIRDLLIVALQYGNCLNSGTKYGRAYGFRLRSLLSLRRIKGSGRENDLLTSILRKLKARGTNLNDFSNLAKLLESAARVDVEHLRSQMFTIKKTLMELEAYTTRQREEQIHDDASDFGPQNHDQSTTSEMYQWRDVLAFCEGGLCRYSEVADLNEEVSKLNQQMLERFIVESRTKDSTQDHLHFWSEFSKSHLRPVIQKVLKTPLRQSL